MPIHQVIIKNYKSIEYVDLNVENMHILLGENSAGKSNIIEGLRYFWDNLCSNNMRNDVFNINNKYTNRIQITVVFDFKDILKKVNHNLNNGDKYQGYYKKIISITDNKRYKEITSYQIRNQSIVWDVDYSTRKLIYSIFPLYWIDTRSINLLNWNTIWDCIGDYQKVDIDKQKLINENMRIELEKSDYGLADKFKYIDSIQKKLGIKLNPLDSRKFAMILSEMYLDGNEFLVMDNVLEMQSNGINTYNYLCLLSYILKGISKNKLKEPLILIDEPEISLHNQLIDKLMDVLFECSGSEIKYIICTHSTRLVKNVLKSMHEHSAIYQVYKNHDNTCISKLRIFQNTKKEKFYINDEYVNAYFSKLLLLVEGETELELFQNKYLKIIYPELEYLDVIKAMSNEVIHKIVSPEQRKYSVPVVSLIDMDKVYSFDLSERRVKIKDYLNIHRKEETFFYGEQRYKTYTQRKKITGMAKGCAFSIENEVIKSSIDRYYRTFVDLIKQYFLNYDIFIAETTIEGMIINSNTYNLVEKFYYERYSNKRKDYDSIQKAVKNSSSNVRLNILRMIFHGNNDYLMTSKKLVKGWKCDEKPVTSYMKQRLDTINPNDWISLWDKCLISKTDWVSEWMEFYFSDLTGFSDSKKIIKELKRDTKKYRNRFKKNYEELDNLIDLICKKYKNNIL